MRAKNTHRSVKRGRQTLVFILVLLRKSCLKSLLQKEPCHYKSPVSSRSGGGMLYHWVNTQSRKEHVISLQPKRQHDRTPVCANKNQTPERIRNQIIYYTQNVPDSGFLITCFHYYKNIYSYAKRKTRYPLPISPSPKRKKGVNLSIRRRKDCQSGEERGQHIDRNLPLHLFLSSKNYGWIYHRDK